MKKLLVLLGILLITSGVSVVTAQTIGSTKTEEFKADFEKKRDISAYMDYEGPKKYIQILKCGIGEEVYEMYPELKEKRVGLGVANIVLEYLDNLNRFEFTEDKTEIKNRSESLFTPGNTKWALWETRSAPAAVTTVSGNSVRTSVSSQLRIASSRV